ncbi:MAG TPA: hypothetical protein VI756_31135 [Blastocatellia bacterium]
MKRRTIEPIDKKMFRQLEDSDQLGKVGGVTLLITYKPTFIDGKSDTIPSDSMTDA